MSQRIVRKHDFGLGFFSACFLACEDRVAGVLISGPGSELFLAGSDARGPTRAFFYGENGMNPSYFQKLLFAAGPFAALRTNFRGWWKTLRGENGKRKQPKLSRDRHLTCAQRENISTGLQDSVMGPVSITAAASDREAVSYEGEIASVLEDTGFKVEINNARRKSPEEDLLRGVEMTISDDTVRPRHAFRIVHAFRRAGIAIATRINSKRRKNNTLYITVGPKASLTPGPPPIQTAAPWQSKILEPLLEK